MVIRNFLKLNRDTCLVISIFSTFSTKIRSPKCTANHTPPTNRLGDKPQRQMSKPPEQIPEAKPKHARTKLKNKSRISRQPVTALANPLNLWHVHLNPMETRDTRHLKASKQASKQSARKKGGLAKRFIVQINHLRWATDCGP